MPHTQSSPSIQAAEGLYRLGDFLRTLEGDRALRALDRLFRLVQLQANPNYLRPRRENTWASSIVEAVKAAPRGLTNLEISERLKAAGKRFPPRSHPTSIILSSIRGREAQLGLRRTRDRRWVFVPPKGQEVAG